MIEKLEAVWQWLPTTRSEEDVESTLVRTFCWTKKVLSFSVPGVVCQCSPSASIDITPCCDRFLHSADNDGSSFRNRVKNSGASGRNSSDEERSEPLLRMLEEWPVLDKIQYSSTIPFNLDEVYGAQPRLHYFFSHLEAAYLNFSWARRQLPRSKHSRQVSYRQNTCLQDKTVGWLNELKVSSQQWYNLCRHQELEHRWTDVRQIQAWIR